MICDAAQKPFQCSLASDPFEVRETLKRARSTWQDWDADGALCDLAEQVLAEVLNNVVEHAHKEQPTGRIEVSVSPLSGGFAIEVRDNGAPMPKGVLPEGKLAEPSSNLEDLPEGGFGWFMIRSLAQDLSYARRAEWNELRFRIDPPA
jgi:serine/threonine-protein kinase RsbW